MQFLAFLCCLFCYSTVALPSASRCKPLPGDPQWPSESAWQALNSSVSGRLIRPIPPGAVCHPSWPEYYDNATCEKVAKDWTQTTFHFKNPESVDYNDEACLPDASAPCSAVHYPSYVVVAASAQDVQAAVKFAKQTGVRLIVKATGHDFPGRSSGPESLSVYTRHIRGIEMVTKLTSSSPTEPAALVKVYAGERNIDVLNFAEANDLTTIGGADPHVGIGGLVLGGGHGPLTAKYGLAADQVVEMDVVTADGEYLTINPNRSPDLFWALRGSGGSTYAVVISITIKAYPSTSISEWDFLYSTTSDSESFWSLAAYFHSQLPRMGDAGVMGYYFVYPLATGVKNTSIQGQVVGQLLGPGLSLAEITKIVKPMEDYISKAKWSAPVYIESGGLEHSNFAKFWAESESPQAAGFSGRLGSRLLDEKALISDLDTLKAALKRSTPAPWPLLGHFTAGPGTHNPPDGIPGGSDAIGPAWRKAYAHVVLPRIWPPLNGSAERQITTALRDVWTEALRELAPDTGAYVNEVDPTEPNWKETLYGKHYSRLLDIKVKYDPSGVFWCHHCVGSDLWREIGPYGIENGVGQNLVKLCTR